MVLYGTSEQKAAVISFNIEGIHPYDIGSIIDKLGIAVRTGHHCAQPIMDYYKIPGTIRASFAFYNTKEEIDLFIDAMKTIADEAQKDPALLQKAPTRCKTRRLDETAAARKPCLAG